MDRRREQLLNAYKSAVEAAARERGIRFRNFMEALLLLPREVADNLRDSYKKQVGVLDNE